MDTCGGWTLIILPPLSINNCVWAQFVRYGLFWKLSGSRILIIRNSWLPVTLRSLPCGHTVDIYLPVSSTSCYYSFRLETQAAAKTCTHVGMWKCQESERMPSRTNKKQVFPPVSPFYWEAWLVLMLLLIQSPAPTPATSPAPVHCHQLLTRLWADTHCHTVSHYCHPNVTHHTTVTLYMSRPVTLTHRHQVNAPASCLNSLSKDTWLQK